MTVKRAIIRTEAGKAQEVVDSINKFALDMVSQDGSSIDVRSYHIAGDIITVHCPQEHFNKIAAIKGIVVVEEAKALPKIKPTR